METKNNAIFDAGPPLLPERFVAVLEAEAAAVSRREAASRSAPLSEGELAERLRRVEESLGRLRTKVSQLESELPRATGAEVEALRADLREMKARLASGSVGLGEQRN